MWKLFARESGVPVSTLSGGKRKQGGIDEGENPIVYTDTNRESDGGIVPKKQPNKANPEAAEDVEGRPPAKMNTGGRESHRADTEPQTDVLQTRKCAKMSQRNGSRR